MITNFKIFDNYNDKVTSVDLIVGSMYSSDYFEDDRILFFIDHIDSFDKYSDVFYVIFKNGTSNFVVLDKYIVYRDMDIDLKNYIIKHNIIEYIVNDFDDPDFIGSFNIKSLNLISKMKDKLLEEIIKRLVLKLCFFFYVNDDIKKVRRKN